MKLHSSVFQSNPRRESGRIAITILVAVGFSCAVVGAMWYSQYVREKAAEQGATETNSLVLSESTQDVLKHLKLPVAIRYYAVLDPASTSESLRAFAARTDRLLSAYEQAADEKLKVTRLDHSDSAPNAASADGLKPFNLDKGDACYLAIVVEGNGQKELLTQLAPEWEPALEFDLSRAIERVGTPKPTGSTPAMAAPPDRSAIDEVRRIIPDPSAVSLDDGKRALREASLEQFKKVVAEMESQLKDAEQSVVEAQKDKPENEQREALQKLQRIQSEQSQRLKQVAERSQAQVTAFEQMKAGQSQ